MARAIGCRTPNAAAGRTRRPDSDPRYDRPEYTPSETRASLLPRPTSHDLAALSTLSHPSTEGLDLGVGGPPPALVSGQAEQGYRPAITLITAQSHCTSDRAPLRFNPAHLKGLAPAGRLDIDSTGLLILTQDGRIAKQLIGEHSGIDKEYLVRVEGALSAHGLAQLNFGLSLDGAPLKRADVTWQNKDQLRCVLREGKKRQIRRMCELVNLKVTGLKRVRIGKVTLGDLPTGQWRYLRTDERF